MAAALTLKRVRELDAERIAAALNAQAEKEGGA